MRLRRDENEERKEKEKKRREGGLDETNRVKFFSLRVVRHLFRVISPGTDAHIICIGRSGPVGYPVQIRVT
jgi:hypothetical protein